MCNKANSSNESLIIISEDGQIQNLNATACEILGFERNELIGQPIEVIFSKNESLIKNSWLNLFRNKNLKREGKTFIPKEGKKVPVWFSTSSLVGMDGNLDGSIFIANDLPKQKHSDKHNKEVESKLPKIYRNDLITNFVLRSLHQSIDLQDVIDNAVESMYVNIDRVDYLGIYLLEAQELILKAQRGLTDEFIMSAGRIPFPKGFTWKTVIDGNPSYCPDVDNDEHIGPAGRKLGIKSYLSMPIKLEDKTIGVAAISSSIRNAFDDEDLNLLENISVQFQTAIKNSRKAEDLKQSEERYRILFYQSPLGVFMFDRELRITQCNEQMVQIFKSSYDKIIGLDLNKLKDKTFVPIAKSAIEGHINHHESFYEPTTGDARLWLSVTASPLLDSDGKVVGGMGVVENITERKQTEEALRETEERLTYIFDNTPNVAIESFDKDGRVLYWNRAAEKIFGFSKDQAIGKTLDQLILDNESTKQFNSVLKEVSETNKSYGPSEWTFINGEGNKGTVYTTIFPIPSSSINVEFICMNIDITELKSQEEQIRHMAMHDYLTDLPNRRKLQETLNRMMKVSKFMKKHALVVMDLDNFKLINDTLGHLEGDQVLIDLAKILRKALRPGDFLARVGGDEFAMIICDVTRGESKSIAERLIKVISGHIYYFKGYNFQISISAGITLIDNKSDPQMIMALAYSALAEAKHEGKNRIIIYRTRDYSEAKFDRASQWGVRINDALQGDRLILHYQPVVGLDNGKILYIEALVRMIDDGNNIIHPKAFIPAAERFGLMSKVDKWVVDRVVSSIGGKNGVRTFVNLSGSSLRDESLLEFIENAVKGNSLISNLIGFEITEFTNITNMDRLSQWMIKLKGLGCQFALDDFGMGYSSFAHLLKLPVDFVKIESSLIQSMDTDPTSSAIVTAIITVSHLMGKEVIAEGVETESVAKILSRLRIKYGQGHYWSKPSGDNFYISKRI